MRRYKSAVILFLLASCQIVIAGTGNSQGDKTSPFKLSLQEAIEYASDHNTAMKSARADLEIAGRRIREITATGLPQVDGSVGYQYYFNIPTSLVPAEFFGGEPGEFAEIRFGTEQNVSASLTVSQLIFDGSYIVGLRASRIYRELARQNVERSELEVRNQVAETYFLVLLSRDNLAIMRSNLANMEQTLDETVKTLEAGFTDPINVDQLKLSVSNLKNRLTSLERQYELSMDLMKFQIGLDLNREIELTDSLTGLFERMMLEAGITGEFDHTEHIDYKIMLSQQNMNLMGLRREQSFSLPRLTASFTHQEMAMRNQFNFTDASHPWFPSSFVSVNLSVPVFSSGLRSSRVQQAKIELTKSELATEEVSQSLQLQINQALTQFKNAMDRYRTEKENLELAERILRTTTIMHTEGMASSLELTQANDQMLATRSNYYNAMFEFITAKNNLDMARGL
jgi:outer membrane protein TolC